MRRELLELEDGTNGQLDVPLLEAPVTQQSVQAIRLIRY